MQKLSARALAVLGLLCALSVVLGTVLSFKAIPLAGTYTVNVALNLLPIQLAGLLFGPLAGFLVGAISDFLKYVLMPVGAYHPGFTLSMAMMGFLPALLMQCMASVHIRLWHTPAQMPPVTLPRLLPAIGVTQLLFSVLLNSFWIAMLQGRSMLLFLPARIINQVVMIPVYSLLLRALVRLYHRMPLSLQ